MTVLKLSKKNLTVTFFISWLIVLFLFFTNIENFIDCMNLFLPPAVFDIDMAVLEVSPLTINIENKNPDSISEIMKKYGVNMPNRYDPQALYLYQYANKYMQKNRYNFIFTPDEIYDIGLNYTTSYSVNGVEVWDENTHKYALCVKNDILFLTKFPVNTEIPKNGDSIKGILVPSSEQTINDLKEMFAESADINNYFPYEFDTTNLFKSEQRSSLLFFIISLLIAGYFIFRAISQYLDKSKRPLYKKIDMLNGDENIINEQLKTAVKDGSTYITDNWIITKSFFRVTITRR